MKMNFLFVIGVLLVVPSVVLTVPVASPNDVTRSEIDKTGSPIYDFLIDYFERLLVFLRTIRTGSPEPPIAEIMPNGAGCADCDTINAFNPFGNMIQQVNQLVQSMNKYVRQLSLEANKIATHG